MQRVKGRQSSLQMKAFQYFHDLFFRVGVADQETPGEYAPHEETPVPRQEEARFPGGDFRQVRVVKRGVVECVEAQEAEPPGELAEVHVQDESGDPERARAEACDSFY